MKKWERKKWLAVGTHWSLFKVNNKSLCFYLTDNLCFYKGQKVKYIEVKNISTIHTSD